MTWSATAIDHLQQRSGLKPRWGVWINARNRETGADEPVGIWQGETDVTLNVEGVPLDFIAAGGALKFDPMIYRSGLTVQTRNVTLNGADPAALQLVRGYDVQFRPALIVLALLYPGTDLLIDVELMFRGEVNAAPQQVGALGGEASIGLELVSSFRSLTRVPNVTKSDAFQRLRQGDRFRRYGTMAGIVDDPHGGK